MHRIETLNRDARTRPARKVVWGRSPALCVGILLLAPAIYAQTASAPAASAAPKAESAPKAGPSAPAGVATPGDYVIGPDDVLTVVFWREADMSRDVAVRPDGKISLPLLNDIQAAGLTPEQLRAMLTEAAGKFVEEPTVSVVVKEIKSRKVFVTGQVGKPGSYPLLGPTTVMQAIATAGGLLEYADAKNVRIMRSEGGKSVSLKFNYKDVMKGKNLRQNVELRPGDTIVVP